MPIFDRTGLGISPEMYSFLQENYELLAAFAYHNYLNRGKGLVWVDWENLANLTPSIFEPNRRDSLIMDLKPSGRAYRQVNGEDMSADLINLVARYNPEESFVMQWEEGGIRSVRSIGSTGSPDQFAPPPACYERNRERLIEFQANFSA